MFSPHTAANLHENNKNKMKDYVVVAGQLGISHLIALSQNKYTEEGAMHANIALKIGRYPNGPTLHFHVNDFSLCSTIKSSQKNPYDSATAYLTPPLLILNNFGADTDVSEENSEARQQIQIMRLTLQHMFPSIDVRSVKISQCRRVVLCNYQSETGLVDIRHYAIRAQATGVSKNIKKLVAVAGNAKQLPNLGELEVLLLHGLAHKN